MLAVTRLFDDFPATWMVCGGWAIDLFVGHQTRAHDDLDVAVDSRSQNRLHQQLVGWQLYAAIGKGYVVWPAGIELEWPAYEIIVQLEGHHPPVFHIILNDLHDGDWRLPAYPGIHRAGPHWKLRTLDGIPFVAPEIALLRKHRKHLPKDEADLQAVLGHMSSDQRSWLRTALERYAPGDAWIAQLGEEHQWPS
jgi:hypothetical protein